MSWQSETLSLFLPDEAWQAIAGYPQSRSPGRAVAEAPMRLPNFLIIGAMKAATTTLYRDLLLHPDVFMPLEKEPDRLCDDFVLTDEGAASYKELFAKAGADQLIGEASTAYTKQPDCSGVANRAAKLLGRDLKVIYLVREPISRIVSHHFHEHSNGLSRADINTAVREQSMFLDWTRYATQVSPWIAALGRSNVLILRFEDYVSDRRTSCAQFCEFLEIPCIADQIDPSKAYHQSDAKPVLRGPWRLFYRNKLYWKYVVPILPLRVKDKLRNWFLPGPPRRPAPPTAQTAEFILNELGHELEGLRLLMGLAEPVWDLNEVRQLLGCANKAAGMIEPAQKSMRSEHRASARI